MNGDGGTERAAMPPVLLVVDSRIDPAVEEAWNAWYDGVHLPEVLACPHFEAGARYVSEADGERAYLAVYSLSTAAALDTPEFAGARGWGAFADKVRFTTRVYTRCDKGAAESGGGR